jgi:hypothetical protein
MCSCKTKASPKQMVMFLPCAKYVVNAKGDVHQVCCVIYSKVKGIEKLFVLNNLLKHIGRHKAKVISVVSSFYFNPKC